MAPRCIPLLTALFVPLLLGPDLPAGRSWYVDETYVNVKGKWCYLYRAIDRDGNLVDSMLSKKRDMEAAKRFDLRKPSMSLVMPRSG